jgi:hypothetical protein
MSVEEDYFVTTDADGSVTAVLSKDGAILERRTYNALGEATYMLADGTVVAESPTGLDIGYRGQLMDLATGLYENHGHWYSSVLGRTIQAPHPQARALSKPGIERIVMRKPILVYECILNHYCEKLVRDCNGSLTDVIPSHTEQVTGRGESTDAKEAAAMAKADAMRKAEAMPCPPGFERKGANSYNRFIGIK